MKSYYVETRGSRRSDGSRDARPGLVQPPAARFLSNWYSRNVTMSEPLWLVCVLVSWPSIGQIQHGHCWRIYLGNSWDPKYASYRRRGRLPAPVRALRLDKELLDGTSWPGQGRPQLRSSGHASERPGLSESEDNSSRPESCLPMLQEPEKYSKIRRLDPDCYTRLILAAISRRAGASFSTLWASRPPPGRPEGGGSWFSALWSIAIGSVSI